MMHGKILTLFICLHGATSYSIYNPYFQSYNPLTYSRFPGRTFPGKKRQVINYSTVKSHNYESRNKDLSQKYIWMIYEAITSIEKSRDND